MAGSGTMTEATGAATKRWTLLEADDDAVRALAKALAVPQPVARSLVGRGLADATEAERFLTPRLSDLSDPLLLPGMPRAVERLWLAVERRESVVVFGDYDVDGISSTALLIVFLAALGIAATPFVPRRVEDGYGLTSESIQRCIEELRPSLIVTVDCGTGAVEAVEWARTQGVDVIVTDHHEAAAEVAAAVAVVNPKLGGPESVRMLAGVGVAFKLCHAMVKQGRIDERPEARDLDLREFMDFVALGTVSDIVPLRGENRILAHHGLVRINGNGRPGLKALISVANIRASVESSHIGFQLGPRLNAAGRMGSADPALQLLLAEEEGQTLHLAQKLDAENRRRQDIENRILREAVEQIEAGFDLSTTYGLVVGGDGWHAGVNGIVASRLVGLYRRPSVVITFDEEGGGRGSCRSIEGFDLVEHLAACAGDLDSFGGHMMAAGVVLRRDRFAAFRAAFNEVASQKLKGADLRPVLSIDAWIDLAEVDLNLQRSAFRLRPFGPGNPQPIWAARDLRIVDRPRFVGKNHLKLLLAGGGRQIEAIGFGMADRKIPEGALDVAFQLRLDTFHGYESLQLNLMDFRPASGDA